MSMKLKPGAKTDKVQAYLFHSPFLNVSMTTIALNTQIGGLTTQFCNTSFEDRSKKAHFLVDCL